VRKLLLIILLWFSASAYADYTWTSYATGASASTADAACQAASNAYQGLPAFAVDYTSSNSFASCYTSDRVHYYGTVALTGSGCTAPLVNNGQNSCVAPVAPTCPTGSAGVAEFQTGHSTNPNATRGDGAFRPGQIYSANGCGVVMKYSPGDAFTCSSRPAADGGLDFFCKVAANYTGAASPSGAPSTGTSTPAAPQSNKGACPSGTVQVGTDSGGFPMCTGTGSSDFKGSSSEVTSSVTNSNNSVTTTTVNTSTNTDNSVTTNTTVVTVNPDGSKNTEVRSTTKAADGSNGKKDATQDDFCVKHPELMSCRNSSVEGSCDSTVCTGDAIQCATLREAQKTSCDFAQQSAIKDLGNMLLSGHDPVLAPDPNSPNVVDLSSTTSSLLATAWLGGGACFPDQSFSLVGKPFVIPWTKTCDGLAGLRVALMFAAYLGAYRLLSRVILTGGV
jgi:hypothetical protein